MRRSTENFVRFADARSIWRVFNEFARQPVAAPRGYVVNDDICLAEWVVPFDEPADAGVTWVLIRQFTINDRDGNYDRMEQFAIRLLY